jgi:hypothetical protein
MAHKLTTFDFRLVAKEEDRFVVLFLVDSFTPLCFIAAASEVEDQ